MKKFILILCAVGLLAVVFTSFILRLKKKPSAAVSSEYSATIISPKTETIPHQQAADMFFREFPLPQSLKAELSTAARTGNIRNEWGEAKISAEELQEAGLMPAQMAQPELENKIKNISAGYSIAEESFAENLNNCLPDKFIPHLPAGSNTPQEGAGFIADEQNRILNSEALAAMGFSALMENKPARAQEAFTALIRNYPETLAAPMAHLELARLMSEEGRFSEARQLLEQFSSLYANEQEYLALAQDLKKEIEVNE